MKYNWKDWLKAAGVRALKTIAQSIIAQLTIEVGIGIGEVEWLHVGEIALLAGVVSLLTSIAGLPELDLQAKLEHIEEEE